MRKVLNEMSRLCKPGGHILLLHRLVPQVHPSLNNHFKKMEIVGIVGVFTIARFSNIRALTVWRKNGTLEGFYDML